jgi:hypothetical protein
MKEWSADYKPFLRAFWVIKAFSLKTLVQVSGAARGCLAKALTVDSGAEIPPLLAG